MFRLHILGMLAIVFALSSCNPYKDMEQVEAADAVLEDIVDGKQIKGAVLSISSPKLEWTGAHGNFDTSDTYFIASTTKLFTTAVIYQMVDEGLLSLDDKISQYLSADIMDGLHVYKDKDYSDQITVRHLLANTSGLPDYFEGKDENGEVLSKELMKGNDQSFSFEEVVKRSKTMKPSFAPGAKGKALYSDTNFQLLGRIMEELSGKSIPEVFEERIIAPLGLQETYVFSDVNDTKPMPLRYKKDELHIPKAMASFAEDGGVVSTAKESLVFCKAFFQGQLFDPQHLEDAKDWNKIFYPNDYGVGLMRYELPGFYGIPAFIGHSGLSGAFVWYCPERDLYVAGTVNQLNKPGTSYRLLARLVSALGE